MYNPVKNNEDTLIVVSIEYLKYVLSGNFHVKFRSQ
jgi:hypothetical protein